MHEVTFRTFFVKHVSSGSGEFLDNNTDSNNAPGINLPANQQLSILSEELYLHPTYYKHVPLWMHQSKTTCSFCKRTKVTNLFRDENEHERREEFPGIKSRRCLDGERLQLFTLRSCNDVVDIVPFAGFAAPTCFCCLGIH
jgi:hypothetical protein